MNQFTLRKIPEEIEKRLRKIAKITEWAWIKQQRNYWTTGKCRNNFNSGKRSGRTVFRFSNGPALSKKQSWTGRIFKASGNRYYRYW